jgi:hypothetical protein
VNGAGSFRPSLAAVNRDESSRYGMLHSQAIKLRMCETIKRLLQRALDLCFKTNP